MSILTAIDAEDGSKSVISTGTELANNLDRDHIILHVISSAENSKQKRTAIEEIVQENIENTELPTIEIKQEKSERGSPANRVAGRILDEAEEMSSNYIVVGSRKRSPVGKAVLGSIAQHVIIDSSTPVVVVDQK